MQIYVTCTKQKNQIQIKRNLPLNEDLFGYPVRIASNNYCRKLHTYRRFRNKSQSFFSCIIISCINLT